MNGSEWIGYVAEELLKLKVKEEWMVSIVHAHSEFPFHELAELFVCEVRLVT